MDLTVREVARLLGRSPETVYGWIRSGRLPAHRAGDHYRLNRVELQEWATGQGVRLPAALFDTVAAKPPVLAEAIGQGGVLREVAGESREQVFDAVARRAGPELGIEPRHLASVLLRREALASTGVGEGIAIPHPRNPVVLHLAEPRVLLCYLARPVDFNAVDGLPVRVLFVLLSPTIRAHLQLLSRIAFVLHDTRLRAMLLAQSPEPELLARLRDLETGALAPEGLPSGSPPKADRA